MIFHFRLLPVMLFFSLLLALGCGPLGRGQGSSDPGGGPLAGSFSPAGSPSGDVYALPPTATAWPTFTPAPTPPPAPPLAPTQTPVPTATAWPRMPSVLVSRPSSSGGPTPEISPTPYGKLHGGDVFLERQVLSVFRGGDLPAYLLSRDWDSLPPPARVVSSDTRYMLWVVVFDFTQAEPDYRMPGFVRWWSFRPGVEPAMMLEAPMTVSAGSPFFYHGLGRDEPGLWTPGRYRVEFLDDRYQLVVDADFEVRS